MKKTKTIVKNVYDGRLTEREAFLRLISKAGADDITRADKGKLAQKCGKDKVSAGTGKNPVDLMAGVGYTDDCESSISGGFAGSLSD